jgi:hypothetical protein
MPKKAASAHHRAQRNKQKAQKGFELVRPERVVPEKEESSATSSRASTATVTQEDPKTSEGALTVAATQKASKTSGKASTTAAQEESKTAEGAATAVDAQKKFKTSERTSTAVNAQEEQETKTQERQNAPAPGSASARLAARRQAAQRLQQRSATTLITSEHFAYVRKDLIRIAVFAVIMFTAIIVLYLTIGRV